MATSNPCTLSEMASDNDFASYTNSVSESTTLVIYFHAPWAEPCKQMSTVLSALASTYTASSPPTVAFLALDAEELSEVSEQYDVTQVPYIVIQKAGKVLETISGGDASRVRAAVEKHVGAGSGNAGAAGLPPAQLVNKPEGASAKNLASYAPSSNDPATAPEYSAAEANPETSKEELNNRLGELVKAAPVMLFMKGTPSAPQCGFSRQTVSLLRDKGIRYGFFNILADDDVRQGLKEFADWPTFPQVWVGGELVGGLDILKEEFENDPDFLGDYVASGKKGGPAA
ncbi:glutaredoxin [Aureobasidium subglaciale]|nr:glutaredoxin [Aureobasidium subglaciale]KAI5276179.1 glutaredoxin [Aureobasidium subglaciale]